MRKLLTGRTELLIRAAAVVVPLLASIVLDTGTTPADVVLLACAGALVVLGRRFPLPVSLGQSAVMVVSLFAGTTSAPLTQLAGGFALGEVAYRRAGLTLLVAWLGNAAATAVFLATSPAPLDLLPTGVRIGLATGIPLVLGSYLRTRAELRGERLRQSLELARAEERVAIARELHDLVAHHMSSILLRVGVARHVRSEVDAVLDDVHAASTAALEDLRRLLVVLRDPASVPQDLVPALRALASEAVEMHIDGDADALDAVTRHAVLRVVQESLTNAAKHGHGVVRVDVSLGDEVTVRVRNAVNRVSVGEGFGLTGMRERVELLGGKLTAGMRDGQWQVRAVLPRRKSDR